LFDKRVINGSVFFEGKFKKTNVYIENEHIKAITDELHDARETVDANRNLVLPGLIDPHVHFHLDLGHIHSRDDFYHGTS
jgi:dihydropyrimidinase